MKRIKRNTLLSILSQLFLIIFDKFSYIFIFIVFITMHEKFGLGFFLIMSLVFTIDMATVPALAHTTDYK